MSDKIIDEHELIPLGDWLEESGFTRPNFTVIKPFLVEGLDYRKKGSRYLIYKNRIKKSILDKDWESLLGVTDEWPT